MISSIKAWNGLNENLERDWVMIDGHDELASLKSRNLQSQKPHQETWHKAYKVFGVSSSEKAMAPFISDR